MLTSYTYVLKKCIRYFTIFGTESDFTFWSAPWKLWLVTKAVMVPRSLFLRSSRDLVLKWQKSSFALVLLVQHLVINLSHSLILICSRWGFSLLLAIPLAWWNLTHDLNDMVFISVCECFFRSNFDKMMKQFQLAMVQKHTLLEFLLPLGGVRNVF